MQPRLVALLALSFVLYVVASVGAAGGALDVGVLALSLVAALCASTPLWVPPQVDGPRWLAHVSALGVSIALGLAASIVPRAHALLGEVLCALMLPIVGVTILRLALYAPDRPPALLRERVATPAAVTLGAICALLGVVAALPPVELAGRALIAPHAWATAPLLAALACFALASALRIARRRLGSGVQALAANLWASLGLVVGELTFGASLVLRVRGERSVADAVLALAGGILVLGHAFAVMPDRARVASARARMLCSLALGTTAATLVIVPLALVTESLTIRVGAFLVTFVAVNRLSRGATFRLLAPAGGVLLEAIEEARSEVLAASELDELAACLLKPLRRAAGLPEAAPLLFVFDPPRIVQLDAAGFARAVDRAAPSALAARLRSHLGEPLITDELVPRLRRRPELDAVVRVLSSHDALCVVPLCARGELTAAVLVARGARRAALTLEELHALELLADATAPLLENFLALERTRRRADESETARAALALKLEEQQVSLAELSGQTSAVTAGLGLPLPERDPIGYSAAMRALAERLVRVAPQALPVWLWGETGLALAPIAQSLHRQSGRSEQPFVIVDCAALVGEAAVARLFGIGTPLGVQPGLLSLVGDGTLLLVDLPALSHPLQLALADLLAEHRGQPLRANASFVFSGRIVATARRSVSVLAEDGALAPELARWFEATSYRVPPLRERPEDLESLLLLSLDRAARVLGTAAKGVEASALEVLLDYDWPGNDAELMSVIERAVEQADGPRIAREHLPPLLLDPVGAAGSSFAEQERAILRRALRQAGGSRTRAARALGLRRAVLVEKLGQLELEDKSNAEN